MLIVYTDTTQVEVLKLYVDTNQKNIYSHYTLLHHIVEIMLGGVFIF